MRILVATDQWFPDHMGGVARIATDTARGWAARGHETVVIAPRHEGAVEGIELEEGLRVVRTLPRGRLPQTLTDPLATRRRASRLDARKFDVLVAHSATSAWGLRAGHPGRPLVYVFHAAAAEEARFLRASVRPGRDWLAALVFEGPLRRMTEHALRDAASVIVLSEFSRSILREISVSAADRAVRVGGGVDTNVFSPADRDEARERLGVPASTRLVFTVRRLEPRMGVENLIEAARSLDDIPELRVVIAGVGRRRELEMLRERLAPGASVDLIGRVPDDELPLWYRAADLFVLPSVAYEGFGLVTAEALASGTPVVGTPVGATPELLEPLESRLISRGTDPAALADAIRTGLRLATLGFRERCRDYALARFSWDAVLPEWERVLDETVNGWAQRSKATAAGLPSVHEA